VPSEVMGFRLELDRDQVVRRLSLPSKSMPAFIYRCPNTGYRIQGFVADNGTKRGANTFEAIECVLCKRVHLVNPETGDVAGEDNE
jgi:hypothetical protein